MKGGPGENKKRKNTLALSLGAVACISPYFLEGKELKGVVILFTKKTEVIPLKDFLSPAARIPKVKPHTTNLFSLFPPITLKSLLPVHDPFALFLIGGGLIVAVALSETLFATSSYSEVAGTISGIFKFVLPVFCYGLIFWFLLSI